MSRELGVLFYIMALGGYRVFYAFNWMYKVAMDPTYSDPQSWLSGIIEILFFSDFLSYQVTGFSILKNAVLNVDDGVNEVVLKAQVKVGLKQEVEMNSIIPGEGQEFRQRRRGGGEDEAEPLGAGGSMLPI